MNLLTWALRYAAADTRIVPVLGKRPPLEQWQAKATTDPDQIRAWWREYPSANIGALGGYRHVPLDVDGEEGRDMLRRLEVEHGELPLTATVASGRDGYGRHYWFSCPQGTAFWTPAPGLEVRGVDHQTLLPPSIHPDTGREYVWLDARRPAPAPRWLLAPAKRKWPIVPEGEALVPLHQRHAALVRILGLLRSCGLGEAVLVEFADSFLNHAVEIDEARLPLNREHARRTARYIARHYPPHRTNGDPRHAEFIDRWATSAEEGR